MKKHFLFLTALVIFIFIFARSLNPLSQTMFTFHDETQPARLLEFVLNLNNGIIPPRIAPHFSFNLGYPVFQFYSPLSYWISSLPILLGMNAASTLQLSFAASLIIGFVAMYFYLRNFVSNVSALLGATMYATAPYIAVEIFVRGNLGEMWFFALFPASLYLLHLNTKAHKNAFVFLATVLVLSFTMTSHNIFSLVFIPLSIVYAVLIPHFKKNLTAWYFATLFSSYFWVPTILENHLTYAREVATLTKYQDHFLCARQLISSSWGYGGSAVGCDLDGMSFKLGRLAIAVSLLGGGVMFLRMIKERQHRLWYGFILVLTAGSIFLTLNYSAPFWKLLSPILSLFQFPWRFLLFAVFGMSVLSAFALDRKNIFIKIAALIVIALLFYSNAKYFVGQTITKQQFLSRYTSSGYIEKSVAYKVAEYLPKTASLTIWRSLEKAPDKKLAQFLLVDRRVPVAPLDGRDVVMEKNTPFSKRISTYSQLALLQIHSFPSWEVKVNDELYDADNLDKLGRPVIVNSQGKKMIIDINYKQTPGGRVGTAITAIIGLILLVLLYKPFWNKLSRMMK